MPEVSNSDWRQILDRAFSEKDQSKSRELLIAAEKAILERLAQPGCSEESPQGVELREALNRLYMNQPKPNPPPGEIADTSDRNGKWWLLLDWSKLALGGGAVVISFIVGWTLAANRQPVIREGAAPEFHSVGEEGPLVPMPRPPETRIATAPVGTSAPVSPEAGKIPSPVGAVETAEHQRPEAGKVASPGGAVDTAEDRRPEAAGPAQDTSLAQESVLAQRISSPRVPGELNVQQGNVNLAPPAEVATGKDAGPIAIPAIEQQPLEPVMKGVVSVNLDSYPEILMPAGLKSELAGTGSSLQIGKPEVRIDPIYPPQAVRQGIDGTVKLHVLISKEGAVEEITSADGPAAFFAAAETAIRQWHFTQTTVGNQPVEVGRNVTVVFRLEKGTASERPSGGANPQSQ